MKIGGKRDRWKYMGLVEIAQSSMQIAGKQEESGLMQNKFENKN